MKKYTAKQIICLEEFHQKNKTDLEDPDSIYRSLSQNVNIPDFPYHEGRPTLEDLETQLFKDKKVF
jgi:hypothetical protein